MSTNTGGDLCRLIVVAPSKSAELALPANVPLADMVPSLADHIGDGVVTDMVGRGVVLQRLGEPPLDEESTAASLGLRDGDTLYLRPRDAPMPTLTYDDLIDGVASRLRDRPGRWTPKTTRRLFLGLATAVLALGLAILLVNGPVWLRATVAGGAALALLTAALAAARAFADRGASVLLGCAAVPYAALTGFLVTAPAGDGVGEERVLATAATATAAAVLARIVTGEAGPLLMGFGSVGAASTIGGLLMTLTPLTNVQSVTIVVALALLFSPVIPSLAFWLAGLRLPDVPTGPEDIGRDVDPVPEQVLTDRTASAEDYVNALYAALAAICSAGMTWLTQSHGWAVTIFTAVVCILLSLRFRMLTNAWQRAAVMVPPVYGCFLLAMRWAANLPPTPRLVGLVLGLIALACVSLVAARVLPNRRPRPYWGRAAELLESLFSATLLPLVLWVLDIYGIIRGLGG